MAFCTRSSSQTLVVMDDQDQIVLVLAPTGQAITETFVRANLKGLPFKTVAYFGDERPLLKPCACLYGIAILVSKVLTRLRWLRIAELPAAFVAFGLIRLHRPNLVLVEFGFEAVRIMRACAWSNVPLVVHFRGSDASAESRLGLLRNRYRHLFAITSGVIVKSAPMAQTLIALGARPERLLVSASGANPQLFYGSKPAARSGIFLAVGRFVPKKGPLFTIQSFTQFCQELYPLSSLPQLWMVGDGPLLNDARQLVADLGMQEQIQLLGSRNQSDVAILMRRSFVFVQHSLVAKDGDSEGNPVAVMEAQLSGLPVVATRHAGIPDVVLHGQSGYLVPEGNISGMARAMASLWRDPELAAQMGEFGRARVLEKFTVDHHLEQVADFIRLLIVK